MGKKLIPRGCVLSGLVRLDAALVPDKIYEDRTYGSEAL
jgi:hypothetical protein